MVGKKRKNVSLVRCATKAICFGFVATLRLLRPNLGFLECRMVLLGTGVPATGCETS